jgi:hypothetical protein
LFNGLPTHLHHPTTTHHHFSSSLFKVDAELDALDNQLSELQATVEPLLAFTAHQFFSNTIEAIKDGSANLLLDAEV